MGETLSQETTVVAVEDAISTTIDDEAVILNLETSTYHGLNEVGSDIWTEIQEPTTVGDLLTTLGAEYDVQEGRLLTDIEAFVTDLADAGLVELLD